MQRIFYCLAAFFMLHSPFSKAFAVTPPAPLPLTGQTNCYDENGGSITCTGTGQDGEIQAGGGWPFPRFVDNGDQTMTDGLTGLIWSKNANPAAVAKTWQQALDYIKTLNSGNFLGHNDWRLPNRNELESLINKGQANSATWLKDQGFPNVQTYYWSGTTSANSTFSAWYVSMYGGYVLNNGKANSYYVWPVRTGQTSTSVYLTPSKTGQTTCHDESGTTISCSGTGQDGELQCGTAWPSPRFTLNADQTVADNLTGLVWSKDANPAVTGKTWQQALDYIMTLNSDNYLGHNDWRLPNPNELESMLNKGQPISAAWLNGQGYSNVQPSFYWSGTTFAGSTYDAWIVDMSYGSMVNGGKSGSFYQGYVWPVRAGQTGPFAMLSLSVMKSGTGSGGITPSSGTFASIGNVVTSSNAPGTRVLLTATPDSGSIFESWRGCDSSAANSCTVTMTTARSVTAIFILADANGACGSSNGGTFAEAPTINLCITGTPSPVTGSGPWTWSCGGGYSKTTASCSAGISQNVPSPIPKTGQTTCYNSSGSVIDCSGTGQDGEILAGVAWPSPRFTANADQSVTDKLTGLIWSKNANPAAGTKTWQQALDYIKTLNNVNYLGHNDWRLPNRIELESLVNKVQADSSLWLTRQGLINVRPDNYWSGTTWSDGTNYALIVNMVGGGVGYTYKSDSYYVWPVRSGQSGSPGSLTLSKTGQTICYDASGATIICSGTGQDGELKTGAAWPSPRFTANADQSVTDNLTGLSWSKNANPAAGTKTWQQALDYIKTLNSGNYLGHNDWRLPNINELKSMLNMGQAISATWLNGQGFSNVQSNLYWSGTSSAISTNSAWLVYLGHDGVLNGYKSGSSYVWPVRLGQSGVFATVSLSVSKTGTGSGIIISNNGTLAWSGNSGTAGYTPGTQVTLTATPDSGSIFTGWSGCDSATGVACTVTMTTNKSVTATFNSNSQTAPSYIPQTGQTTCYNSSSAISCSSTGQDGELKMGVAWPSPRFADNGDLTMTDKLTGLIWSKNANPAAGIKTWQQALDYIKALNSSNYLNHNDWRLPNCNELESLVNKGQTNSAVWLNGQGFSNVQSNSYWSSSSYSNSATSAWYIDMTAGSAGFNGKGNLGGAVWPMRSGQSGFFGTLTLAKTGQTTCYDAGGATISCSGAGQDGELQTGAAWPYPRFTANADQTVTDSLTGLIWSKDGNPAGTKTWQQALDYIKSLNSGNYLGHNDWRLPNRNELESLVNKGQANGATWLNGQGFSNAQSSLGYWTGTTYILNANFAWYVNMNGSVKGSDKSGSVYVWPVRSGQYTVPLSVSKTGTGSGSIISNNGTLAWNGTNGSAGYAPGIQVVLTATPASDSTFVGWSGACGGAGTCTMTMDAAKSVTAQFNLIPTASIIWRHQGDGKEYGMTTNGSSINGGAQFYQEPDMAWSIVGQGDFDGDGIKDFVWWNNRTGQVFIMLMASTTSIKSGAILYTESNTNWKITAVGDIDGDGKSDLIWWNNSTGQVYAMLLNGSTVTGGGLIYTEPNTNWKIVAAADFNGNGKAELLWWNSSTGQAALGQTNGTSASTATVIWTEPDTNWKIAGAGDLDGDGKADIIWHNRTTGQIYGMQTNGSSVTNGAMMYTEPNTNWEIVSVGNYNGDSKAELLWWNQQTGQVYLMPLNGLTIGSGGVLLYTEPDTTWHIQGETEWRDNLYGKGVTTTTK